MRTSLITLALALTLTPAAQAQECLATLTGCTACILPTGGVTLADCGGSGGSSCPPFPASLLVADPDTDGGLHTLLVSRLLADWAAGGATRTLYQDERRTFAAAALFGVIKANPAAVGSGAEWLRADGPALLERAAGCLRSAVVGRFGSTDGTGRYGIVPQSTAGAHGCSGFEDSWLIRKVSGKLPEAGLAEISQDEMRPFFVESLMAVAEPDADDFLAGVAAQLREKLGEEGALEALAGLAIEISEVGADGEGGRQ